MTNVIQDSRGKIYFILLCVLCVAIIIGCIVIINNNNSKISSLQALYDFAKSENSKLQSENSRLAAENLQINNLSNTINYKTTELNNCRLERDSYLNENKRLQKINNDLSARLSVPAEKPKQYACNLCKDKHTLDCSACGGDGNFDEKCVNCKGNGFVVHAQCQGTGMTTCLVCQGKMDKYGKIIGCANCHFTGKSKCICKNNGKPECNKCNRKGTIETPCKTCKSTGSVDCSCKKN